MDDIYNLKRFILAQDISYDNALKEIKRGRKFSHWIWYIFPQLSFLGRSETAQFYGIKTAEEARAYLDNPILREHLIEISESLYQLDDSITNIMGYPDNLKLKSSMTLFNYIAPEISIFQKILDKFYNGEKDQLTIQYLNEKKRDGNMKEYEKYIFDLDYTLLIPDWSKEDDYFIKHVAKSEQEAFFEQKQSILNEYELIFPRYDFKTLSNYFKKHGFNISEEVIKGWMIYNGENIKDEVTPGTIELLSFLKEHKKEIVILTSWFSGTQIPRLKRAGLYDYIDKIVAGEDAMKPDLESFELAIGNTPKSKCIMIGDSIKSDKNGAINAGIDYYIVDKEHSIKDFYELTKKKVR